MRRNRSSDLPQPPAAPSGIDAETLAQTKALMGERIHTLKRYFLEDAREYMQIINAVAEGTRPISEAVRAAHTLKSSAQQLGLLRLSALAQRIEQLGRQEPDATGAQPPIHALLTPLRAAMAQAEEYLKSAP